MFLNRAHRASRYYGTLLKDVKKEIFVDGHFPIAYYVSAYGLFRVESLLRKRLIENRYRPYKYHLLGILRMLVAGPDMPSMTANRFEKYCEILRDILWDDHRCRLRLLASCGILDKILKGRYSRDKAKDSTIQSQAKTHITAAQVEN